MKFYQKDMDDDCIIFNDPKLLEKIYNEYELNDQINELKKIKDNLEFINSRLDRIFNDLHLPSYYLERDKYGDWIILGYNKKTSEIDNIDNTCLGKKLKDIYPSIKEYGLLDIFDKVYEDGQSRKFSGYYKDNRIKGYRNSYVYRIDLDNGVKNIVSIYEDVTSVVKIKKYKKIFYTLLFFIIFFIGSFHYLLPEKYSNEELFNKYYSTDVFINSYRSSDNKMFDALYRFKHDDFENSLVLFNDILDEDNNNLLVKFYSGVANVELENYDESIRIFSEIKNDENLYTEYALWYLGLVQLKINNLNEASKIFNQIKNDPNNYYNIEAEEILNEIK